MSFLLDALTYLGIYFTPARILALGTGAGKGNTYDAIISNPPFGDYTMSITITRGRNSFEYRQREQNPCELESRATYKGSRWQFIARFDTAEQARAALLALIAPAASPQAQRSGGDGEAKWRQAAAEQEQEQEGEA